MNVADVVNIQFVEGLFNLTGHGSRPLAATRVFSRLSSVILEECKTVSRPTMMTALILLIETFCRSADIPVDTFIEYLQPA